LVCPGSGSDRGDAFRASHEAVPGIAGCSNDCLIPVEDPVRQFVLTGKLPDVLDRVQLGQFGKQRQQREVVGNAQLFGGMPSRLIEDDLADTKGETNALTPYEMPDADQSRLRLSPTSVGNDVEN
jgi:hypothetical protein